MDTDAPTVRDVTAERGGSVVLPVLRWCGGEAQRESTEVADEVPVAFEYNGVSHAVMLATPRDLDDFGLGFSLSEGIVDAPEEIYGIEVRAEVNGGITLAIDMAAESFADLKQRRRTLAGRTGCGICGAESLEQVFRPLPDLRSAEVSLSPAALARATACLREAQPLQRVTGATHGAAWCALDGSIQFVREDVGRHNALDKLIGVLAARRIVSRSGFALVTSRASVEMVQKAAMAGIAVLAAVSAPTALATRVANDAGLTLIGFARGERFSLYAHPARITD